MNTRGIPSQVWTGGGDTHPVLGWPGQGRYPQGNTSPVLTWDLTLTGRVYPGVPPVQTWNWGSPPLRPGMRYPPHSDLGWGIPIKTWDGLNPIQTWNGVPPPTSGQVLTDYILPSLILRMRAVSEILLSHWPYGLGKETSWNSVSLNYVQSKF